MVKLTGTLNRLNPCKVLLAGDLILDVYTIGKAKRISPEAPVAVVHVAREDHQPGGAGNVALNLSALGASTALLGRIGDDEAGRVLVSQLESQGVDTRGVSVQRGLLTPRKNRIIADYQQIVRVDYETIVPLAEEMEAHLIDLIPSLIENVQVIALSDYGKGTLTPELIKALIAQAKQRGIPVIVDPKGIDFQKYRNATIIKPNLGETYAAANLMPHEPLEKAAAALLRATQAKTLMVTRAELGISLFHSDGHRSDFPVRAREVKDVTGAGDTVLATLTIALANGLSIEEAAQLSNVSAGIAIERIGCAKVTLADLARRLLENDAENKVFDKEHLFALQEAMKGVPYTVIETSSQEGLTTDLFKTIRFKKNEDKDVLVYINDASPDPEFVNLLSSLREVNFIVICSESLSEIVHIRPPVDYVQMTPA